MTQPSETGRTVGLDEMLCFALYSASNAFNRAYRPMLDRLGLTYPQYLVLVTLGERDAMTVSEIGELLFLESNTLTPLLKRLEAAGLVSRQRDPADERQVRVRLTDTGRALRADACRVTLELGRDLALSEEETAVLRYQVSALRDALVGGATDARNQRPAATSPATSL